MSVNALSMAVNSGDQARTAWLMRLAWLLQRFALFGVPVVALLLTGGFEFGSFWLMIVVGAWMGWFVLVYPMIVASGLLILILYPIRYLLGRTWPGAVGVLDGACVVVVGAVAFGWLFLEGFGPMVPDGVRYPGPWPGLGVLLVLVLTAGAVVGFWTLGETVSLKAMRLNPRIPVGPSTIPNSTPHLPDVPIVVREEPLVSWRVWWWDPDGLKGVREVWDSVDKQAACQDGCESAPDLTCTCGIYSTKDIPFHHVGYGDAPVVGRVEIYGDVIEHERGYRSSHARIIELWTEDESLFVELTIRYPEALAIFGKPTGEERGETWET